MDMKTKPMIHVQWNFLEDIYVVFIIKYFLLFYYCEIVFNTFKKNV